MRTSLASEIITRRQSIDLNPVRRRTSAFTLIELLVVISIITLLAVVTITSFNYSVAADRMRAAARQYQSFVAGARDKAIYANDVRGVRLLLDPSDNHTATGMQYIGSPQQETGYLTFSQGTNDPSGKTVYFNSVGTSWDSLQRRGLLQVGNRIQIPSGTGSWFTIAAMNPPTPVTGTVPVLTLSQGNPNFANSMSKVPYTLELQAGILGDSQPVLFPRGVVVDLDGSLVPKKWRPPTFSSSYSIQMDILFSPRGAVVGDAASLGMMHLHFADAGEVFKWHSISGRSSGSYTVAASPVVPANNYNPVSPATPIIAVTRDRILATLGIRNGVVSVHYVNEAVDPLNLSTPVAQDPYSFAETGQVANK